MVRPAKLYSVASKNIMQIPFEANAGRKLWGGHLIRFHFGNRKLAGKMLKEDIKFALIWFLCGKAGPFRFERFKL